MRYDRNYDCVNNAYMNLLRFRREGKEGNVIFRFYNPTHAYLVVAGKVLNKGYTWYDNSYPDFTRDQLYQQIRRGEAEDLTNSLDFAAQQGLYGVFHVGGIPFRLLFDPSKI